MSAVPVRKEISIFAEIRIRYDSQDLFVFIEDRNAIQIYKKIFQRIYGDDFKVEKVYSMGNKQGVMEKFKEWYDNTRDLSKCVFIVDKDYNFLLSSTFIDSTNLIELEKYTIENYLIQQEAIIKYILIHKHNISEEKVLEKLSWSTWRNEMDVGFTNLFINFAIAFKYDLAQNCGQSPHIFLQKTDHRIDEHAIQEYNALIREKCEEFGIDYNLEMEEIKKLFMVENQLDYDTLIKGKYLLQSLIKYIKVMFDMKHIDINSLNYILADELNDEDFEFLKKKVSEIH